MITSRTDFEHAVAWELEVLSQAIPLTPLATEGISLDLRDNSVTLRLAGIAIGEGNVEAFRDKLLPLLFGASWKILDLYIEISLDDAGKRPNGKRWTIQEKAALASRSFASIQLAELPFTHGIPCALTQLYQKTMELRHALVHRRVRVDPVSSSLIEISEAGGALANMTKSEQLAFCRTAQRLATVVSAGKLHPRIAIDVCGLLASLSRLHDIKTLGSGLTRPPVRLAHQLPADNLLDVAAVMAQAKKTFPGVSCVDIELHLAEGLVLEGELELAPLDRVYIDPASPPAWLRRI